MKPRSASPRWAKVDDRLPTPRVLVFPTRSLRPPHELPSCPPHHLPSRPPAWPLPLVAAAACGDRWRSALARRSRSSCETAAAVLAQNLKRDGATLLSNVEVAGQMGQVGYPVANIDHLEHSQAAAR